MFDNLRPDSTRGIRQRAKKHAEQSRTIDNMSRDKHEKNYQNLILIAEAIILVCILWGIQNYLWFLQNQLWDGIVGYSIKKW